MSILPPLPPSPPPEPIEPVANTWGRIAVFVNGSCSAAPPEQARAATNAMDALQRSQLPCDNPSYLPGSAVESALAEFLRVCPPPPPPPTMSPCVVPKYRAYEISPADEAYAAIVAAYEAARRQHRQQTHDRQCAALRILHAARARAAAEKAAVEDAALVSSIRGGLLPLYEEVRELRELLLRRI